jgi:NTE family protein
MAHIGVIEVLEQEGFRITHVAGSSMGAAVGGIYCAGHLAAFRQWAVALTQYETFRLMDFTFSGQGMIKGQKVMQAIRDMMGQDPEIADFGTRFTAVATDAISKEEVWLNSGNLFDVMRASSAIPTLLTPVRAGGRLLIDGGVLNPLPIEPLLPLENRLLVVVNINAPDNPELKTLAEAEPATSQEMEKVADDYRTRMYTSVRSWLNMRSQPTERTEATLGYFGLLNKSFDMMQDRLCQRAIELHRPDIVIEIPRNVGTTLEFYRAADLIEEGRRAAIRAVENWKAAQ